MKAVVKYGKGKGLVEIRDVPEPTMKEDEVLIEVLSKEDKACDLRKSCKRDAQVMEAATKD